LAQTSSHEQMLEFCQTVSPTLEDYEADGVSFLWILFVVGFLTPMTIGVAHTVRWFRRLEVYPVWQSHLGLPLRIQCLLQLSGQLTHTHIYIPLTHRCDLHHRLYVHTPSLLLCLFTSLSCASYLMFSFIHALNRFFCIIAYGFPTLTIYWAYYWWIFAVVFSPARA